MLETAKLSIVILSVLTAVGGIMGFVKGKSKASLIAGVGSAIALVGCFIFVGQNARQGLLAAFVVCIVLEFIFYARMKKTKKAMPGGPLLASCLIAQYFILQGVPPVQ